MSKYNEQVREDNVFYQEGRSDERSEWLECLRKFKDVFIEVPTNKLKKCKICNKLLRKPFYRYGLFYTVHKSCWENKCFGELENVE